MMNEKEITGRVFISALIRSRRMLVSFFLIAIVLAYSVYVLSPKQYTAGAIILPIAGEESGIAGFLAGTGLGALTHSETKANVLLIVLESQSIAENVVRELDLAEYLLKKDKKQLVPRDNRIAAARLSRGVMNSSISKNGSIVISATLADQDRVAGLVNSYLEELAVILKEKAINMNFSVIDKGQRPLSPSAPRLIRNMTIALGIAFFFSFIYLAFNLSYGRQE